MKKHTKKLKLSRETVRDLDTRDLREAVGGTEIEPTTGFFRCIGQSTSWFC